ncbi:hypothetical protein C8J57DRAFT_1502402 [Mycena rebaudengoi]|nr:hypothetical protein C8J57DRAFT_1502402 [Mycena rebaudengoi]
MPAIYTTIAAASSTRIRIDKPPAKKSAPLAADELKEKRAKRADRQAAIDEAVSEWREYTNMKAQELAAIYDMKPRYFLDIFFQGGARMIHHQEKINAYNAFKHEKAAEAREQGLAKTVPQLHTDHIEEYYALTDEEKGALVERFRDIKSRNFSLRRDTPRAKIQDVANIVRNMKMLMTALGDRVGIEGFFCIVRNNAEFHVAPEWHFTSPELENYLPIATRRKWDTGEVGMKLEAFAVAGCDPANLLRTAKQKADWMKAEIRDLVSKSLVEVSKVPNAIMAYTWHEEDVVQNELSTSLPALRTLVEALKSGQCAFRKLLPAEAETRKLKWEADVAAGRVVAKNRAQRSDAGVPRKRAHNEDKENDPNTDNTDNDNTDDAGNTNNDAAHNTSSDAPSAPPKKRARKTTTTSIPRASKPAARRATATSGVAHKALATQRAKSSRAIISDDEEDNGPDTTSASVPGASTSLPTMPATSALPA